MEKRNKCDVKGSGLNSFQRVHLPRAIRDYFERNPSLGDIDSAGMEFIQGQNYRAWASGIKARYCNFICPVKVDCGIIWDTPAYPHQDVELSGVRRALETKGLDFLYVPSKRELQAEVGRNKWFISQKKNYEVCWGIAEEDYIANYLDDFERGFCINEPPEIVRKELEEYELTKVFAEIIGQ